MLNRDDAETFVLYEPADTIRVQSELMYGRGPPASTSAAAMVRTCSPLFPCGHMTPRRQEAWRKFCVNWVVYAVPVETNCFDNMASGGGGDVVNYQWVDCDRSAVSSRYDRIAHLIPLFDRLFFVPWNLRRNAAGELGL